MIKAKWKIICDNCEIILKIKDIISYRDFIESTEECGWRYDGHLKKDLCSKCVEDLKVIPITTKKKEKKKS